MKHFIRRPNDTEDSSIRGVPQVLACFDAWFKGVYVVTESGWRLNGFLVGADQRREVLTLLIGDLEVEVAYGAIIYISAR
jgi:hypothetical protein